MQLLSQFLMFIQDEHENGITYANILELIKESYNNFCLTKAIYYIQSGKWQKKEVKRSSDGSDIPDQSEDPILNGEPKV